MRCQPRMTCAPGRRRSGSRVSRILRSPGNAGWERGAHLAAIRLLHECTHERPRACGASQAPAASAECPTGFIPCSAPSPCFPGRSAAARRAGAASVAGWLTCRSSERRCTPASPPPSSSGLARGPMAPRAFGRRPGKAARRAPTAATTDAARWVLGTRPRMTPALSQRRWLAGAVPDVGMAHRSLRLTAAPSTCFPGRSAAARRAGVASVAGSAPLPTVHFLLLTAYWLLATGYWLLAIRHPPLPNLSTPANPVPYSPSFRFIEGVLRRRSGAEAE